MMPKVPVYNMEGSQVGEIDLNDAIFGTEVNVPLLHQATVMYSANERQGTSATKTRAEVRGGGRKPWRQKGTGRARHGSIRSPIWVGGGVTFGPQPRSYRQSLPKKARRAAMKSALSAKHERGNIIVLESAELKEAKTKYVATMLEKVKANGSTLIVLEQPNQDFERSARNIPNVQLQNVNRLNVRDVLRHETLVITRDALAKVEEVLA